MTPSGSTSGELEINSPSSESMKMEDFDKDLFEKYKTRADSKQKKRSIFNRLARILLKDCKDESFKYDITDLYISYYGRLPNNGMIRKKIMVAALAYLRREPRVMYNWATFAAKIT